MSRPAAVPAGRGHARPRRPRVPPRLADRIPARPARRGERRRVGSVVPRPPPRRLRDIPPCARRDPRRAHRRPAPRSQSRSRSSSSRSPRPLLLSTDAWSYWSYGWIGSTGGGNPYSQLPTAFPESPALPWMGSAWRGTTSVYGPAFTLASEPLALAARDSEVVAAWEYKSLAALAVIVSALARRPARTPARARDRLRGLEPGPRDSRRPAAGTTTPGSGRSCSRRSRSPRTRRVQGAGVMWAIAIAVKWVPILFLTLRAVEARATGRARGCRGFSISAAAIAVAATLLYGTDWLRRDRPARRERRPRDELRAPEPPRAGLGVPAGLALALALAAFAARLRLAAPRDGRAGRARLGLAACLVLVTTPYLAVWYLAWAVPTRRCRRRPAGARSAASSSACTSSRRRFRSRP